MKITSLIFNPFQESTYVLWHEDGKDAFLVDPGMMMQAERDLFAEFIERHHLNITKIILTHIHIDHVIGVAWASKKYGASIEFSEQDNAMLNIMNLQVAMMGLDVKFEQFDASNYLHDGDLLNLNGETIKVLEVPGHSRGSLAFYAPQSKKVITGDALFCGSIGRTDLPGGSYEQLINSITSKLITLPDDTDVYPGHGECTTISQEKRFNPFLR